MHSRTQKLRLASLLAVIAAVAGGILTGLVTLYGKGQIPSALLGLFFVVVLAIMFAAMLPWWRRLDHMERDGHLTSWYWGGSFGGGLGLLLLMLVDSPSSQLVMGAVLVWAAQIIGYAAVLIGWKLTYRSADS